MKNKINAHKYIHHTRGVCPPEIHFKINDGKINDLRFVGGGCPGNAQLVSRLLADMPLTEVLSLIKGIDCRNGTSCSAELARAIQAVQNGMLHTADSFKVQEDDIQRQSTALIGNLAGDNRALQHILEHVRVCGIDSILCLGNLTGDSPHNQDLLQTIRCGRMVALQGQTDWLYTRNLDQSDNLKIETTMKEWLFQLPQVLSFRLKHRRGMAFYGDYIQSFAGYSDFEPFALEMNMVSGLTDFMQDESVFPALEAMVPQFQADIIVFSQLKTWGSWHVGGKDFISVGAALAESGLTWGRLEDKHGRVELKIMDVPS